MIRVNINFGSSVLGMILEGGGGIKGTLERVQEMGKYPLSIYPKAFQIIFINADSLCGYFLCACGGAFGKGRLKILFSTSCSNGALHWTAKMVI